MAELQRLGVWCRKGHVIDDDGGQCHPVGVAFLAPAHFEWDGEWIIDGEEPRSTEGAPDPRIAGVIGEAFADAVGWRPAARVVDAVAQAVWDWLAEGDVP